VKLAQLLWRFAFEADGASVTASGWLTIDWLTHTERRATMPVEEATLTGIVGVLDGITRAKYLENCVVKAL
jgi:hypothetical protein